MSGHRDRPSPSSSAAGDDTSAGDDAPASAGRGRDDRIETMFEWPSPVDENATVVVVTYRTDEAALRRTLDALADQTVDDFGVVVVDNGVAWDLPAELADRDRVRAYAGLRRNYGVTVARNVGAHLADSDLLVFLDDDAVPAPDFVESHRDVHRDADVVAVRGRVRPLTDTVYNRLQVHYDLGDEPRPALLDIEGNTSIDRDAFRAVDGFDESLAGRAGHEGRELTYRLVEEAGHDRTAIRYHPAPVVYHDYATSALDYVCKRAARADTADRLRDRNPDLVRFFRRYESASWEDADLSRAERLLSLVLTAVVVSLRRLRSTRGT